MINKMKAFSLGILLFSCLIATVATQSYAHRHEGSADYYRMGYEQRGHREDGGGGALGQMAAWFFGIANFPVVLSILLKTYGKMLTPGSSRIEAIGRINRKQKQYLMKLHYWLNPAAAAAAIIHFSLTKCPSTLIPELGLGIMLLIFILGLMLTFKLSPAFMRKGVFKFHTSPISLAVIISILLIGHSMID